MKKKAEAPEFDYLEIAYNNLMPLKKAADEEGMKRAKIQYSEEYIKLNRQIAMAQLEQKEMLEGLDEKTAIYEEAKKIFSKVMSDQGKTSFREWKAKLRKVKKVDNRRLLSVLDGDIDTFIAMANVTQVALKAHAEGNMDKEALMSCIEEFEQIVDVEFQTSHQD